jgi:hypothetical protein
MAVVMFLLLILLVLSRFVRSEFRMQWGVANKTVCDAIDCGNSSTCSYDSGEKIGFGMRESSYPLDEACSFLANTSVIYNASHILDKVGENGVLVFTGDSIMRSLFITFLHMAGGDLLGWYQRLEAMSLNWTGAVRDRIDHTFLCSQPLGTLNTTVAFLWRPMLGNTLNRVPWVAASMPGRRGRCVWWENGDAMRHCDSSHYDGAQHRWNFSDTLDTVQLPGRPERNFVVVSSGGQHTVVDAVHSVHGNNTHHLSLAKHFFADPLTAMESTKPHFEVLDAASVFYGPGSPASVGDGMHYPDISNRAVLQLLAHRLVHYNASTWRADAASWNRTSALLDHACPNSSAQSHQW